MVTGFPMTDVAWAGYPRSYTKGRARPIQFIVLHYTAGSEGPTSAEAGVRYDKIRTDGTSTHYFTDSQGPALQEVPDGDRAHAARYHGNEIGIQIEICGTIQTRSQWLDPVSLATLTTTAGLVAMLLGRHNLAFHRLSTAEVRAAYFNRPGQRPTGICEHADCTLGFPEDGGSHMDVGAGFPWDVFMDLVGQQLKGGGQDMPKTFVINEVVDGPQGRIPANALYASGGSGFHHVKDAVFYGRTWGIDPFANTGNPMPLAEAYRRFGPFLGEPEELVTEPGPVGPPGPATLVAHTHGFNFDGSTGDAVAED